MRVVEGKRALCCLSLQHRMCSFQSKVHTLPGDELYGLVMYVMRYLAVAFSIPRLHALSPELAPRIY